MLKKLKLFMMLALFAFNSLHAFNNFEKMYVDEGTQFNAVDDCFYTHVGENMWVMSDSIYQDANGIFEYQYESSSLSYGEKTGYVRKWKCPYCNSWWEVGQACHNPECPSKYRG